MIEETSTRAGYNFVGYATTNGQTSEVVTIESLGDTYTGLTEYLIGEECGAGIYLYDGAYYIFNLTTEETEITVYVIWSAGTSTYQTEYYLQLIDGTFVKDTGFSEEGITITPHSSTAPISETTDKTATIDQSVKYEGFTLDLSVQGTLTSGVVTGDNGLVLKLYYTRNSYNVCN